MMIKLLQYFYYFSMAITAIALASAFSITGFFIGSILAIVVMIVWGLSIWRKWTVVSHISLLILILGISLGVIIEGPRLLLLVTLMAALSTWDLGVFNQQLSSNENINEPDQLVRTHLLRLVAVLLLGFTLPLLAFSFQFDFKVWQVFLLGILLLAGLSQVFIQLKHSSTN